MGLPRLPAGVILWVAVQSSVCLAQTVRPEECIVLAFGDVNLGRQVGEKIFAGDTMYPFRLIRSLVSSGDVVFANLESPLTEQGGETRHPSDPIRFCGPMAGAISLAEAGIGIVSGANNHAYDYGKRGLEETIFALREHGISLVGLGDGHAPPKPFVMTASNGIRIGIAAYTEFVNVKGSWKPNIALFDVRTVQRDITWLRQRTDIIIASYHGGEEYAERPPRGTLRNLRFLAEAGADIVLGHHPHVPQGVEIRDDAVIFYSLGNFVFHQPQHYWTQIGLAACLHLAKERTNGIRKTVHIIPFKAGLQPSRTLTEAELDSLDERLNTSSPAILRRTGSTYLLEDHDQSPL